MSATNDARGASSLTRPASGRVMVTLSRQGCLWTCRSVDGVAGDWLAMPDIVALGGDVNQDDGGDVAEAALMGRAWKSTPDHERREERAVMADDGALTVLDRVTAQFNGERSAPGLQAPGGAQADP